MLRRIHDPERGAGFTEYGAVILLVAAITAAVITSGVSGRVQAFIASAIDSVEDGGGDGEDGDGPEATEGSDEGNGPGDGEGEGDGSGSGDPGGDIVPASETNDDERPDENADDEGDGGGGFWSGVGDTFSAIGDGIGNAATEAWDGVVDGWDGLVDGAQRLWDDPGQWASDTWGGFTEGLSGTWDQITTDPLGWAGDVLFSETVQENWANGNYWEAGSQAVVENAVAFIPFVGWAKKAERIADIADGPGNDRDGNGNGDNNEDGNDGDGDRRNDELAEEDTYDPPSCTPGNSFVPGTPVLLADGSTLPIENVAIGDQVLGFDPLTGEEGPREVTDLITGTGSKTLVTLTIDSGDGATDTLTATDAHPFWVPDRAEWVDAADLEPGTWLRTSAGTWAQVTSIDTRAADDQRVHNLTVADLHTYYVLAAQTPVLVHNLDPCEWASHTENAGDLAGRYTEGQSTRDPASQMYHEYLSDEELLDAINNAEEGDGIAVSPGGTILGGHHRWDELQTRINDGRIDPNTPIRIDVYEGEE
ncbi:polymorphic toxin-type HINT domain-containing protein [Nocardiopsis sediminis]|uniref:Polymorphic toxin-type HINT domain-containing protein n=1 Tax=Nocardiopsis sediminis TaxID=1778267 RepID=A0ABV8FWI8_9ACTN